MRTTKEVQSRLNKLGFGPLKVDGIPGPKTDAAMLKYEQFKGLAPKPYLREKTINSMFEATPFGRAAFYDAIRNDVGLTIKNVAGMEKHLDYILSNPMPLGHAAYGIATSWWETAQTMHPVREAFWLSEDWRRRNLRYYPWYGRGLVQTTWEENYKKMGDEMGVDLLEDPDKLLLFEYALPALFIGMEKGIYTGRSFDDFIDEVDEDDNEDFREYKEARRIVNGTDKATRIAEIALAFEKALKRGGYEGVNQ